MCCAADWMACMSYDSSTVMQETEISMVIKIFLAQKCFYVFVSIKRLVYDEVRFLWTHPVPK